MWPQNIELATDKVIKKMKNIIIHSVKQKA